MAAADWTCGPANTIFPLQRRAIGRQLVWIEHLDSESMDTGGEFVGKFVHYCPVLRHTRLTGKLSGRDSDAEMRLSSFAPASMAMMARALVNDFKMAGSEFSGKFLLDFIANGHSIADLGWCRT